MKATLKLAIVGIAVIGGAAHAANINTLPTAPTGSSLVLVMKDYTKNLYFVQELTGTNVLQFNSAATLTSAGAGQYSLDGTGLPGSLTVPTALTTFSSPTAASFLSSNSGDNIQWSILGARVGTGTGVTGAQSAVFVSPEDYLAEVHYTGGTDAITMVQGISSFFTNEVNTSTYTNNVSSSAGWNSSNVYGAAAGNTFNSVNTPNGAAIGTAQYIYQIANSDGGVGANVYKSVAQLTLNANGTFSYSGSDLGGGTAPVPVPAAVWLLGSGLVSLAGVARRRKLEVKAA